jgi:molybdopterin adenylyltransferase
MSASVRVVAVTVSDTRAQHDDMGGAALCERLDAAGFTVAARTIVRDHVGPGARAHRARLRS